MFTGDHSEELRQKEEQMELLLSLNEWQGDRKNSWEEEKERGGEDGAGREGKEGRETTSGRLCVSKRNSVIFRIYLRKKEKNSIYGAQCLKIENPPNRQPPSQIPEPDC